MCVRGARLNDGHHSRSFSVCTSVQNVNFRNCLQESGNRLVTVSLKGQITAKHICQFIRAIFTRVSKKLDKDTFLGRNTSDNDPHFTLEVFLAVILTVD